MTLILFDCESFIHRACTACKVLQQCRDDKFIYGEYYDVRKGKEYFDNIVSEIIDNTGAQDIILVVGDKNNWRKEYYPQYKAQRKPVPDIYPHVKSYICESYETVSLPNLEADDTVRIMVEDFTNYPTRKIVAAIDKDLRSFPCEYYNVDTKELIIVDKPTAEYNLMKQVIMGDATDNYKGIPKYGDVTTEKFLNSEPRIWEDVRQLFLENKMAPTYIINKNLASMVSLDRYNFETGEVKLLKD